VVAIRLVERQAGRELSRRRIGKRVDRRDHRAVGDRVDRLAVDHVARRLLRVAGVDASLRVELLPVDREPLRPDPLAIDRERRPDVPDGVATAVARDVALAAERRIEQQAGRWRHRRARRGLGHRLPSQRGGQAVLDQTGQRRTRRKRQMHVEETCLRGSERAGLHVWIIHHQAPGDRVRVERGEDATVVGVEDVERVERDRVRGEVRQLDLVDDVEGAIRSLDRDGRGDDTHADRRQLIRVRRDRRLGRRRAPKRRQQEQRDTDGDGAQHGAEGPERGSTSSVHARRLHLVPLVHARGGRDRVKKLVGPSAEHLSVGGRPVELSAPRRAPQPRFDRSPFPAW
jgi:hypothetical protein